MSGTQSIDSSSENVEPRAYGRYVLYAPIARGGMATIHIARLVGDDGFSRIVAAKRLHPQFTEDPEFVAMFRDEAEIASRINHPNVVPVLDIVLAGEEVILVQEYVHGVPLDRIVRASRLLHQPVPPRVAVAVVAGILAGLHSAHETTDEKGEPMGIIHRDVSPQNVMVTVDGIPRLLDFGIAKARSSAHVTRAGLLKGKIAYMAPEQVRGEEVTPASDVYACGVVLWELLALERLHAGRSEAQILSSVLSGAVSTVTEALEPHRATISEERWSLITQLEPIVSKAIATLPKNRYATAAEMLSALVDAVPAASAVEVAEWVKERSGDYLERRQQVLASNEDSWRSSSRIAVARPAGSAPQSGVMRVSADAGVVSVATVTSPSASSRSQPTTITAELVAPTGRARVVPWVVAAASLLLSATLVGALGARHETPSEAPAPALLPVRVAAPVVAPVPVTAPDPTPSAVSFLSALPVPTAAPKPVRSPSNPAAASGRKSPAESSASPSRNAAAPVPVATGNQVLPPSPKTDCDPPFFYEGTKKVFKPSCI